MPLPDSPSGSTSDAASQTLHATRPHDGRNDGSTALGDPLRSVALTLTDEAATHAFAARLATTLGPGTVVWLCGTLGAGKTTLVRGLLRALGHAGPVRSPTFTLLEPYELPRFPVFHFDLYRFGCAQEWHDAGFDDYFGKTGVCLVEWPEQAEGAVPAPDVRIALAFSGEPGQASARTVELQAFTRAGLQCVNAIADGC